MVLLVAGLQVFKLWQIMLRYGMDVNAVGDLYRHVGEFWLKSESDAVEVALMMGQMIDIAQEGLQEANKEEAKTEEEPKTLLESASVVGCSALWRP